MDLETDLGMESEGLALRGTEVAELETKLILCPVIDHGEGMNGRTT